MSYKQEAIAALEVHQGQYKGLSASVVAGCIQVIRELPEEDILSGEELAEVACALNLLKDYQNIGAADRLRELVQAEKDGRLVVLPWAIGQTIYEADPDHGVVKHTLKNAILDMESTAVDDAGNTWPDFWCSDDESLAHITREEAEAALAKQKEKQE